MWSFCDKVSSYEINDKLNVKIGSCCFSIFDCAVATKGMDLKLNAMMLFKIETEKVGSSEPCDATGCGFACVRSLKCGAHILWSAATF